MSTEYSRSGSGRFTLLSDPVHGFISVPHNVLKRLIETPEVQRLRRIRQLGVGYLVFPGAEHSRFGHALGAMALMHDVLGTLSEKGTRISKEEHEAACAAALLHDVGHGPFSHSLEHELIDDFYHEVMSRAMLSDLNNRMSGALATTLAMFDGTYPREFFHDLIASQLDMDRLDYLRRDSYYTGVVEGTIGVERILKTLCVVTEGGIERLAIEEKGSYAVESFLISRRLMYWQVYLHKAVLAGDHLLRAALRRARGLFSGPPDPALERTAPALAYFLSRSISSAEVDSNPVLRQRYVELDDADILYSLKSWSQSRDAVLADLSQRFLDRRLFRVTMVSGRVDQPAWRSATRRYLAEAGLATADSSEDISEYYLTFGAARHDAYASDAGAIVVAGRDGSLRELTLAADSDAISVLSGSQVKHYVCHPKAVTA